MRIRIVLDVEVGTEPYADAISYFIFQYGSDTQHLVEEPTDDDKAEAAERVLLDILHSEVQESDILQDGNWGILDSHVSVVTP